MAIGGNYGPLPVDLTPLSNLGDFITDQMEKKKAGAAFQQYVAQQLGAAGGAPLAAMGASAAPTAPSMTGGGRRAMVMPPEAYAPLIQKAAAEHRVEPDILTRLLKQESGFDVNAVSPAGAMGIAQFMPGTAKRFG